RAPQALRSSVRHPRRRGAGGFSGGSGTMSLVANGARITLAAVGMFVASAVTATRGYPEGAVSAPDRTAAIGSGPAYPLRIGPTHRYLVDQRGAPFLIVGDSPQSLIANLSERLADKFFGNRNAAGFNAVWINLLCKTYTGGRSDGSTCAGIVPFTTPGNL